MANGTGFIFDYHDGTYGWNESAERGADTFHPFSSVKLLWTNPNPTTSFYATTINVQNLDKYKSLIIDTRYSSTASTWEYSGIFVIPINQNHDYFIFEGAHVNFRKVSISEGQISIGNAQSNNTFAIPYKIYGTTIEIYSEPIN